MSDDNLTLRVRVAVLETELASTRKELEESKKASLHLLGLHTAALAAPPSPADLHVHDDSKQQTDRLKQQIDSLKQQMADLRFENADLKNQLQHWDLPQQKFRNKRRHRLVVWDDDGATDDDDVSSTVSTASSKSIGTRAMLAGTSEWEGKPPGSEPAIAPSPASPDSFTPNETSNEAPPEVGAETQTNELALEVESSEQRVLQSAVASPFHSRKPSRASRSGIKFNENANGFAVANPVTPSALPSYAVLITGLSSATSLCRLIPRIRGGQVFLIRLVDTRGIDGGMNAFVRFLEAASARRFVERHRSMPLIVPNTQGAFTMHDVAHVSLVPTSSWRAPPGFINRARMAQMTRCFSIFAPELVAVNSAETIVSMVEKLVGSDLVVRTKIHHADGKTDNEPHDAKYSKEYQPTPGSIYIECSSMEAAENGRNILLTGPFRGCKSHFEADPCSGPFFEHMLEGIGRADKKTESDQRDRDEANNASSDRHVLEMEEEEDYNEIPPYMNPDAINIEQILTDSDTSSGESDQNTPKTPDTSGDEVVDLLL